MSIHRNDKNNVCANLSHGHSNNSTLGHYVQTKFWGMYEIITYIANNTRILTLMKTFCCQKMMYDGNPNDNRLPCITVSKFACTFSGPSITMRPPVSDYYIIIMKIVLLNSLEYLIISVHEQWNTTLHCQTYSTNRVPFTLRSPLSVNMYTIP